MIETGIVGLYPVLILCKPRRKNVTSDYVIRFSNTIV